MSITELLFNFNGRIRRSTYWLYAIGLSVVLSVLFVVAGMLAANGGAMMYVAFAIYIVGMVIAIWAGLALQIKRWHDRDKSWTWIFIAFVPFIGAIWALVECGFLDGTPGPNKYGPSPKGLTGSTVAT